MTPSRRWSVVGVAVALIVVAPFLVRRLPVHAPDPSATAVLALIRSVSATGYSGTVELTGAVNLPVTSRFTDVGSLLSGRTTLRVWWRDHGDWRVDKLLLAGETDLFHHDHHTVEWRYESAKATVSTDPEIRLPRSEDLLPPVLAERAVRGASAANATRLAARRVAGIAAVGLRIRPPDQRSSIDHVDLWADPSTGIVLQLALYPTPHGDPSFSTTFTSFSAVRPAAAVTRFAPPAGVDVRVEQVLDIADAANQYAPVVPPAVLAGLKRTGRATGAVGLYGTGLTQILAIPLRGGDAASLRDQIRSTPGVVATDAGPALMAGPLGVLVTDLGDRDWLVVGAVTRATLVRAADELVNQVRHL